MRVLVSHPPALSCKCRRGSQLLEHEHSRPRRTIALTRATEDAERSAARLLELGYPSLVAPVTMVLATQARIPRCDYDAVVATSAKAFDLLSPFSRDAILALPLFVVGAQTARAAAARELEVEASAKDAAALAESLCARLTPASRVLYLAGRDRKSDLQERACRGRPSRDADRGLRRGGSPRRPSGSARGGELRRGAALFGPERRELAGAAARGSAAFAELPRAAPRLHFRGRGLAAALEAAQRASAPPRTRTKTRCLPRSPMPSAQATELGAPFPRKRQLATGDPPHRGCDPLSPLNRFGSGSNGAERPVRAPSPMSLANPIFLSAFVGCDPK